VSRNTARKIRRRNQPTRKQLVRELLKYRESIAELQMTAGAIDAEEQRKARLRAAGIVLPPEG
jgi:hypothetical protein